MLIGLSLTSGTNAQSKMWDGGAGTFSWNDANNWNPDGLPGPSDDVLIDLPGAITVTHSNGVTVINSLVCNENFNLSGGTLEVAASSQFNGTINISGAATTLTGAGDITITAVCNWTGGFMAGDGVLYVPPGGHLIMDGSAIKEFTRTIDANGIVEYRNGTMRVGAYLSVSDPPNAVGSGQAALILNSPPSGSSKSFVSINSAAGIETSTTPTGFTAVDDRAGNTNPIRIFAPFTNTGVVTVQNGVTLVLDEFISAAGSTVTIQAGSELDLSGSSTHEAGSSISGAGTLRFSGSGSGEHIFMTGSDINMSSPVFLNGGTVVLDVAETFHDLVIQNIGGQGPTLSGAGDVTITGSLQWVSGAMSGTGKTIIAPGAQVVMDNMGTGSGAMTFTRTIENLGEATWTSGGVVAQNGTGMFINGSSGGALVGANDGVLHIDSTTSAISSNSSTGASALVNYGLISRDNPTGTPQLTISLAPGCALSMRGGSNEPGGVITAAANSTLTFASGSFTHKAGSSITFDGSLQLTTSNVSIVESGCTFTPNGFINMTSPPSAAPSTTLNFNGDFDIPRLTMNFGGFSGICTLGGTGTVTITDTFTAPGCIMQDSGLTIIAPGAIANLGGSTMSLRRTFENEGACTRTGGSFNFNNGIFRNRVGGTLNLNNAGSMSFSHSGSAAFYNEGIVQKTGAGVVSMFTGLDFNVQPISNTGTIVVNAGTMNMGGNGTNDLVQVTGTTLTGGTWIVGPGATLGLTVASPLQTLGTGAQVTLDGAGSAFTALSALRTISMGAAFNLLNGRDFLITPTGGTFTNNGTLALGTGCDFDISGAYLQGPTGVLDVTVTGPSDSPLVASGALALNGTVRAAAAPFPAAPTTYTLASGASRSGVFAASLLSPNGVMAYSTTSAQWNAWRLGDINGNGVVNVEDLLAVIAAWGTCPTPPLTCPADLAPAPGGDGVVNVADLLAVIANWG